MKTKSLFIAVFTLIAFAGNVLAQKDITSQYITNATLSNGTTGWTVSNFNAPQRGNNTVGYASEAYAGWGSLEKTSYSLLQNITLPAGSYRLVNYSFFRQGEAYNTNSEKSLAYLKAGSTQVALKTLGSITAAGYANSQAEGANCFDSKMYRNVVEFTIDADNTTIEIGITGTFDEMRSWCIAGMFELFDLDDAASVSSPTDVTYAITNPGFEYRNATGWTSDNCGGYANNDNFGHKAGIGFVERWQSSSSGGLSNGTFTQTLTGLENGLYELAVYAQNREQYNNDADGTGMYVKANNDRTQIISSGQHKVRTTVTDGNLSIGIQLDNCSGNWIAFDRFTLLFYGDPDAATRELLSNAITEAQGIGTDYLTSAQKSTLNQAVTDAQTALANSQNLSTALDNLTAAISTARQQIQTTKHNRTQMLAALERFENDYNLADGTDYSRQTMSAAAWTDLLTKVNAVTTALDNVEQSGDYATIKDDLIAQMDATDASLRLFKSYKAMAEGVSVLGGSSAELASDTNTDATEEEAIARLNTAFGTYAAKQAADFSAAAFLGSNLDFSAAEGSELNTENSNNIRAINGWEVEYADADTWTVLRNQHGEHLGQLYMRKNWGSSATTLLAAKQKMLPVGKYTLSFSWNSNMQNMTNRSQFKVGENVTAIGEATDGARTLTYDFEVTGNAQPFDLVFGFQKTGTGNTPAQLIVDDVTLTCLGANSRLLADYDPTALWFDAIDSKYAAAQGVSVTPTAPNQIIKAASADQFTNTQNVIVNGNCANLVLTDGQPIDVKETFRATTVTNNRTLKQDDDAYTVCLPYSLSSNSSVQFYELTSINEDKLRFTAVATTTAMKPYLAVANADASLNASDVDIAVTTEKPIEVGGFVMKGTVTGISRAEAEELGAYILQSGNEWKIVDAESSVNVHIPAFRAYIVATSSGARMLIASEFVDKTTGIEGRQPVEVREAEFYDLQGRLVGTRPVTKGLYVVSGKKVIKK